MEPVNAYRHVVKVATSDPVQLVQDISQLSGTRGVATSNLQLRERFLDRRIQNFKKVLGLVAIRKHARIVARVKVRLIVGAKHGNRHILLLLVEANDLDQVVCVRLSPVGCAVASTNTADQAAVAFVLVAFHATWCTPGVGVDEQVRVVLESRLGQVDLTCVVAVPGVVERSCWCCRARAEDGALGRRLNEIAYDG
jgi:hypothetical protein